MSGTTTNDAGNASAPIAPGPAADGAAAPDVAPAPAISSPAPSVAPQASDSPAGTSDAGTPAIAPEQADAPAGGKPGELKPHTDTPTLLEELGKDKTTEPPKPEATPEPARTYEDFTFPDGIEADKEQLGKYTELLTQHGLDQAAGQALLDLHTSALKEYAEHTLAEQHRVFANTRAEWKSQVLADEQLGGAGHQTTMAAVARMRDLLVGSEPARVKAFEDFLRVTGAGDHPEFLRLFHNAARYFDEPTVPTHVGTPTPNNGRQPGRSGYAAVMYDNSRTQRRG